MTKIRPSVQKRKVNLVFGYCVPDSFESPWKAGSTGTLEKAG
ncbi:MAG: hypothetical protein ACR2PX_26885 [Endozoicomonas sp.]